MQKKPCGIWPDVTVRELYGGNKFLVVEHTSKAYRPYASELFFSSGALSEISQIFSNKWIFTGLRLRFDDGPYNIKSLLNLFRANRNKINLRYIEIHITDIAPGIKKDLLDFIREFPTIEQLDLSRCGLMDDDMTIVAEMIKASAIRCLNLGWNHINEEGFSQLATALSREHWARLESLNLTRNSIGDLGGLKLATCIPLTNLKTLLLSECLMDELSIVEILEACKGSKIEVLDMQSNDVGSTNSILALKCFLANSRTIRELCLKYCGITNDGVANITPAVRKCHTLTRLHLQGNHDMTTSAVLQMVNSIGHHPNLVEVGVCGCEEPYVTGTLNIERKNARLEIWVTQRSMLAIVSARVIKRIGCKSPLSVLPTELFRMLQIMLGK